MKNRPNQVTAKQRHCADRAGRLNAQTHGFHQVFDTLSASTKGKLNDVRQSLIQTYYVAQDDPLRMFLAHSASFHMFKALRGQAKLFQVEDDSLLAFNATPNDPVRLTTWARLLITEERETLKALRELSKTIPNIEESEND